MSFKKLHNLFILVLILLVRKTVNIFPNSVSVLLGKNGFTQAIKRSPDVRFKAKIYNSDYSINVQGNYAVERLATQRRMDRSDPFRGIKKLNLQNCTAIDIGANVGTISIGLVDLGVKRVFSIEPGPLHDRLLANIHLNLLSQVISPHKIGLSSLKGELLWAEDKNNPGNAHLVASDESISFSKIPTKFKSDEFIRVPVTTLDDFVTENNIEAIDILKIDVEGMEWEVLKGGKDTISKNLPIIVAETHRVASDMMKYDCLTPMFYYLYELGYKSYSLNAEGDLIEFIYPNFSLDTFFIHPQHSLD